MLKADFAPTDHLTLHESAPENDVAYGVAAGPVIDRDECAPRIEWSAKVGWNRD